MTITSTKTTKKPTLSTPEGTLLRLVDNTSLAAGIGALAVVGDGTTSGPDFLDVRWLKGHLSEKGIAQRDGGYFPESFEILEFQIGDRVRVHGVPFENGYEGVIDSAPATNGDDCLVAVDKGLPKGRLVSYKFSHLHKIPKLPKPTFAEGDVVVIDFGTHPHAPALAKWEGLRFKIAKAHDGMPFLADGVIDNRPDSADSDFYWEYPWLRKFDPSRDFRVGDLVETDTFYGRSKGVVTKTKIERGGNIEIDWTSGAQSLVDSPPLGANRERLTLVGVDRTPKPLVVGDRVKVIDAKGDRAAVLGALGEVVAVDNDLLHVAQDGGVRTIQFAWRFERSNEPKQPIRSNFTFAAGQEIGSSEVLDDLPTGTVLHINGDTESPTIKLVGNPGKAKFARINRFGLLRNGRPASYDEGRSVAQAADGNGTVMIAYVPSESR